MPTPTRPVPARRHDPAMQNYVYEGEQGMLPREQADSFVARVARVLRQTLGLAVHKLSS